MGAFSFFFLFLRADYVPTLGEGMVVVMRRSM